MTRYDVVEHTILAALGNASVSTEGFVQLIHRSHSDIKHVAFIKTDDLRQFTVCVQYNDRTSDSYSFARGNWSEQNA